MRLVLLALVTAASIAPTTGPKPKISYLFTLKNHVVRDPAASADGRRIYYVQDSTDLFMYDRTTRKTAHALGNMQAPSSSPYRQSAIAWLFANRGRRGTVLICGRWPSILAADYRAAQRVVSASSRP